MNESAIACVEKTTKKRLGVIPRTHLFSEIANVRQLTGIVRYCKPDDTWYCELSQVQQPDSEIYADMKRYCEIHKIPMPAYDVRAYSAFLKTVAVSEQQVRFPLTGSP
jgi:hypothetical protein